VFNKTEAKHTHKMLFCMFNIKIYKNNESIYLTEEYENLYFLCLEDWSDEMKEACDHKEKWYEKIKKKISKKIKKL